MRLKADLVLGFVSLVWGAGFVGQRVAGELGSVYLFNGARYSLAALVVAPLALRPQRAPGLFSRRQWMWMSLAGLILFIAAALQQVGLQYTTAANAGFLTSLYVVFVPLVLLVLRRERPSWAVVAAVTLAGAGAFLLSLGGRYQAHAGDLLELAGGLFWAFHVVLIGKAAGRFEPMSFAAGQLAVCGLLNLGVGVSLETVPTHDLARLAAAVAFTGVFSLGIGYSLQVWSQRHTPPSDAALILSMESVVAALCGWTMLGELLSASQLLGCMLILIAVVLTQARRRREGTGLAREAARRAPSWRGRRGAG